MTVKNKGAVLALDYGQKKVGLAVSPDSRTSLPLTSLRCQEWSGLAGKISKICQQYQVGQLVVGWPLTSQDKVGRAARRAEKFGHCLARVLNLPVAFQNEFLTSYFARERQKKLKQQGIRRAPTEDSLAAQLILQDYLERLEL